MNYKSIKEKLYEEGEHQCAYCGKELSAKDLADVEHVIPLQKGGDFNEDNLVLVCHECNLRKASKDLKDYLFIARTEDEKYYESFLNELKNIEELLRLEPNSVTAQKTFYNLLFLDAVVSLETYLSDALINNIKNNPLMIRSAIEGIKEFENRTVKVSEIYRTIEESEKMVMEYLSEILYHNLAKVEQVYQAIFGIRFRSDKEMIYRIIQTRHDIAHRNGRKQYSDQYIQLNEAKLKECIRCIKDFVETIEVQFQVIKRKDITESVKNKLLNALQKEIE